MTNRIFAHSESNLTNPNALRSVNALRSFNAQRPVNSARQQHLIFAADLDRQILEFERRHLVEATAPSIPQQRISTAASTAHVEDESYIFDDFGLVQGIEIDVRWM